LKRDVHFARALPEDAVMTSSGCHNDSLIRHNASGAGTIRMKPTDYTPIDCNSYSEYELAIMHRKHLRVSWRDVEGPTRIEVLVPVDLRTRQGEEFLVAIDSLGAEREIRLDRILDSKCL
jgi:Rho-binding antiterminator